MSALSQRMSAVLVAAALATGALSLAIGIDPAQTAVVSLDPPPAFVVVAAKNGAAALGDPDPTSAFYFRTRRESAVERSSGDSVNSDQQVFLVVITGSFVAKDVSRPFGAPAPTGTVASYVIDARTGTVTDFGLAPKAFPLTHLGARGDLMPYLTGKLIAPCAAPVLRANASFGGATGSLLGGMRVTNRDPTSCTLPTSAKVALSWRGQQLAVKSTAFPPGWLASMSSRWKQRVRVLHPHQHAVVVLQWMNWCGSWPRQQQSFRPTVELFLPASVLPLRATLGYGVRPPFCNHPPSTLRVSPFVPPS